MCEIAYRAESSTWLRVSVCLFAAVVTMCSCCKREPSPYYMDPARRQYSDEIMRKQPPELVAKARSALDGQLAEVWVWDDDDDWLSKRVFNFTDVYGEEATFLETDGDYIQINCPSGIPALNEILSEYTFAKEDFDDRKKTHYFLEEIEHYYGAVGGSCVASSVFLETDARKEMGDRADWLQGKEKNEAVLVRLCKDPRFEFEGNKWRVTFNVFEPDGSVDKWEVTGEYDPGTQSNKIHTIDVSRLKRRGTFFYPVAG